MAEQEISALFHVLSNQITGLTTTIGAQSVAQIIKIFDGDPKRYKEWVKSVEKYTVLTNIETDRIKFVAYQARKGVVSDFINMHITNNPRDY